MFFVKNLLHLIAYPMIFYWINFRPMVCPLILYPFLSPTYQVGNSKLKLMVSWAVGLTSKKGYPKGQSWGRQSNALERSIRTAATYWFFSRAFRQSSNNLSRVVWHPWPLMFLLIGLKLTKCRLIQINFRHLRLGRTLLTKTWRFVYRILHFHVKRRHFPNTSDL
jgi:hypothetical protein